MAVFAVVFVMLLARALTPPGIDALALALALPLEAPPGLETDAVAGALGCQYRAWWSLSGSGGWWSNESGMYAKRRSSCGRIGEGVRGLDDEELVRDWTSYTASIGESRERGKKVVSRDSGGGREMGERGARVVKRSGRI